MTLAQSRRRRRLSRHGLWRHPKVRSSGAMRLASSQLRASSPLRLKRLQTRVTLTPAQPTRCVTSAFPAQSISSPDAITSRRVWWSFILSANILLLIYARRSMSRRLRLTRQAIRGSACATPAKIRCCNGSTRKVWCFPMSTLKDGFLSYVRTKTNILTDKLRRATILLRARFAVITATVRVWIVTRF